MYVPVNTKGIFLNVTDACNLRCRYCFVNYEPHYMSLDVAKKAVDVLMEANKNNKEPVQVIFFGGEPTLCWDSIIVPIVEYCKEKKYNVSYPITSNCTLLTEERIKFMSENKFSLLFSIDGVKEVQDYNRPCADGSGSFDLIEPNIKYILKYLPETTFRSTLIPETCEHLYENILYAAELGFSSCFMVPDSWSTWSAENKEVLRKNLRQFSLYYIESFRNNTIPISLVPLAHWIHYLPTLKKHIDNNTAVTRKKVTCGTGQSYVSVNYEGKIFACQQTVTWGEDDNKYFIGDIYNGIDIDRHIALLEDYHNGESICENKDKCNTCLIKPMCETLLCHSTAYDKFKDINLKAEIFCDWETMLCEEAIFITNVLIANDNTLFKKYTKVESVK